jgi:hypothetical protein
MQLPEQHDDPYAGGTHIAPDHRHPVDQPQVVVRAICQTSSTRAPNSFPNVRDVEQNFTRSA